MNPWLPFTYLVSSLQLVWYIKVHLTFYNIHVAYFKWQILQVLLDYNKSLLGHLLNDALCPTFKLKESLDQ